MDKNVADVADFPARNAIGRSVPSWYAQSLLISRISLLLHDQSPNDEHGAVVVLCRLVSDKGKGPESALDQSARAQTEATGAVALPRIRSCRVPSL